MVMTFVNTGTTCLVGNDKGEYPGTVKEYNVRLFETKHELSNVSFSSEMVKDIIGNNEGYGCIWGDSTRLYNVTDEQVLQLIDLNNQIKKERKERKELEEAQENETYQRLIKNGLCPKCGSFCYGDCES